MTNNNTAITKQPPKTNEVSCEAQQSDQGITPFVRKGAHSQIIQTNIVTTQQQPKVGCKAGLQSCIEQSGKRVSTFLTYIACCPCICGLHAVHGIATGCAGWVN